MMCVGVLKQRSQYIDTISNLYIVEAEAWRAPSIRVKMLPAESLDCLFAESSQNDAPKDMPLKCVKQTTHHEPVFLETVERILRAMVET